MLMQKLSAIGQAGQHTERQGLNKEDPQLRSVYPTRRRKVTEESNCTLLGEVILAVDRALRTNQSAPYEGYSSTEWNHAF